MHKQESKKRGRPQKFCTNTTEQQERCTAKRDAEPKSSRDGAEKWRPSPQNQSLFTSCCPDDLFSCSFTTPFDEMLAIGRMCENVYAARVHVAMFCVYFTLSVRKPEECKLCGAARDAKSRQSRDCEEGAIRCTEHKLHCARKERGARISNTKYCMSMLRPFIFNTTKIHKRDEKPQIEQRPKTNGRECCLKKQGETRHSMSGIGVQLELACSAGM